MLIRTSSRAGGDGCTSIRPGGAPPSCAGVTHTTSHARIRTPTNEASSFPPGSIRTTGTDLMLASACRHPSAARVPLLPPSGKEQGHKRGDYAISSPNGPTSRKAHRIGGLFVNYAGDHLISHTLTRAVPSAQRGLTSVFGMGTGGTLVVNSPASFRKMRRSAIVHN